MLTKQQCRKWIQKLRSGDHEQGRGALRKRAVEGVESWCCLGVLADQLVNEPDSNFRWQGWRLRRTRASLHFKGAGVNAHNSSDTYIPDQHILTPNQQERLACCNDQGYTFTEIADIIEQDILPELPEES